MPATPPFFLANNLRVVYAAEGKAECEIDILPWLSGTPELGIQAGLAALLDSALSYAASTDSRPGIMLVTLGLRIQFCQGPPEVGSTLVGSGAVSTSIGPAILVQGRAALGDATLATAALQSLPVAIGAGAVRVTAGPPTIVTAAPSDQKRPANRGVAAPVNLSVPVASAAIDAVMRLPVSQLCRLQLAETGPESVRLGAVAPPSFERTDGVVHGGAVPILGQLACAAVWVTALPAGVRAQRIELAVDYLRPTGVGVPLELRAAMISRSRRTAMARAEVVDDAGRITARVEERSVIGPQGAT